MNKQCEIVQDLLPLYIDNVCSKSSAEMVEDHVSECSECLKLRDKMKNGNCERALRTETQSVIKHHAKSQNRKTLIVGSSIAGILCIPIIVCLIVNLAVGHALDWFFIVLTALMVFASLVVVPLVVEKQKGLWTIGSFTVSLMLLLVTCAIYTKGNWFGLVGASVLFGLSVVLMPYIAYKIMQRGFWKHHKGLFVLGINTILLFIMLFSIGIYVKSALYWKATPPITLFSVGFVWLIFLVCRYLRVDKLIRAGITCILSGTFLFSIDYVIDLVVGNVPSWVVIDMDTWNSVTEDDKIKSIIFIVSIVIGMILIGSGLICRLKGNDKNDED